MRVTNSLKFYDNLGVQLPMKLNEITIRDPFILLFEEKYYLYGTRSFTCWKKPANLDALGFDVYVSEDLENWHQPIEVFRRPENFWGTQNFWAPEVHVYKGEFYMFASFIGESRQRGTQILRAKHPTGPFVVHSKPITPEEHTCLDGTLYVDKNEKPYMIFCHEWTQIKDGTICAVELSEDLTKAIGEPKVLFKGSDPSWADADAEQYVTDGPFIYRTKTGELLMFWSSIKGGKYIQAIAKSSNRDIDGKWENLEQLLYSDDGGHGMVFKTKEGQLYFTLHHPNLKYHEHPCFLEIEDIGESVVKKDS